MQAQIQRLIKLKIVAKANMHKINQVSKDDHKMQSFIKDFEIFLDTPATEANLDYQMVKLGNDMHFINTYMDNV